MIIEHNIIEQTGPITWAIDTIRSFRFTDNIVNCFLSSGGYQGIYGPGFARGGNGPIARYFPGITDANQLFHRNVLIGGTVSDYSNYVTSSTNHFPASRDQWTGDDNIGANLDEIKDSMVFVPQCITVSVSPPAVVAGGDVRVLGSRVEIQPFDSDLPRKVEVIDLRGIVVYSFTIPSGEMATFDLLTLPRGVYVVRVDTRSALVVR